MILILYLLSYTLLFLHDIVTVSYHLTSTSPTVWVAMTFQEWFYCKHTSIPIQLT